MGLLAELTHRCPLQCPYCSNPLELERATGELSTAEWCRVLDEAADLGVLQVHLSGGEPTARTDLEAIVAHARGLGPLHQPDHGRRAARRAAYRKPARRRPGARPAQPPGSRAQRRRPNRRLSRWARQEARCGPRSPRRRPAIDRQCRGPPAEPRSARGHGGLGSGTRRASTRSGSCPILWLGTDQPRRPHAHPRAAGGCHRDRRAVTAASCGGASPSTTSSPTTGPNGPSPAWAAGAARSSTSRLRAR